jgi:hypothetical protein
VANVPAFISNLGPNKKSKMLKVGLKFFWPWLLVWSGSQKSKKTKQKNIGKKKKNKFYLKTNQKNIEKTNKVYLVFLEQGADSRLSIGHMICPSFLPLVHNSQIWSSGALQQLSNYATPSNLPIRFGVRF